MPLRSFTDHRGIRRQMETAPVGETFLWRPQPGINFLLRQWWSDMIPRLLFLNRWFVLLGIPLNRETRGAYDFLVLFLISKHTPSTSQYPLFSHSAMGSTGTYIYIYIYILSFSPPPRFLSCYWPIKRNSIQTANIDVVWVIDVTHLGHCELLRINMDYNLGEHGNT